ncbi:MAG: hypothetical protein ACNS62_01900 [Candidatus Cyclobacteriaceae bacterium M3_2C_046]
MLEGSSNEPEADLLSGLNVSHNPFSEFVNFSFDLEETSEVSIEIFDVHGKLIDQISRNCKSGLQQIKWEANGDILKGGKTLLYRFRAGAVEYTGKLLVK